MIGGVSRALRGAVAAASLLLWGCATRPIDPLQLDQGLLTVNNRTQEDWRDVEIWLNRSYRVPVPIIAAGARFQVTLRSFVSGFGRPYDVDRMTVDELRLTARTPTGKLVELHRPPRTQGSASAPGGKR